MKGLFATTSLSTLLFVSLLAGAAHAAEAEAVRVDEVIVTAQKRAENVQDVPQAVQVVSSSQLAAAGVREFCLVLTHPKLRGATGAWTSPIALV